MTTSTKSPAGGRGTLPWEIWELLGHPIAHDKPAWSNLIEAREILRRHPLPYRSFANITVTLHIDESELAKILGFASRTIQRRKEKQELPVNESILLFRVAEILATADRVFSGMDTAIEWLKRKNRAFDFQTPISLLSDDIGRKLVEDELGRIEHGIYA